MSKYPNVQVRLTGQNANIYNLLAVCRIAAEEAGVPKGDLKAFTDEAFRQESYDEALETCRRWFSIS